MASRAVAPRQENKGDAVAGGGKQKKAAAEGGGRRRALGDIGNLATLRGNDGKPLPQISRPATRSFCAQLLANAQAAAAENNKPKLACVNVNGGPVIDGAAAGKVKEAKVAGRAAPKKVAVVQPPLPSQVTVIEISPDIVEETKKPKPTNKKKAAEASRKKAPTLTSVLTARSKAACGVTEKPKVFIEDIDAKDAKNELAAVEYVEDMYTYYKDAEGENKVRDYMGWQPEINERMRAILVDWLIEVHHKFELTDETLYLAVNIVDRFLSVNTVPRRELQLLGISAMLMASKYEEIWAPEVNDFVCISDRAYTSQQILVMEKTILAKLEWTLTVPTPYVFLVRFIKASISDLEMQNMVNFFAELGTMNYEFVKYCPSMMAASAVYAARCTLNKIPAWTDTLQLHTGFSEQQLMECAKLLAGFHSTIMDNKLKVVYKKYSNPERKAVALLPPAKALLS